MCCGLARSVWLTQTCSAHLPCRVCRHWDKWLFSPQEMFAADQVTSARRVAAPVLSSSAVCSTTQDTWGSPLFPRTFSWHDPLPTILDPSPWMSPGPSISLRLPGPGHHFLSPGSLQRPPNHSGWPQAPSPHIVARVSFPNCNSGHVLAELKTLQ